MRFKYILFAVALFTFYSAKPNNNFNLKTVVIDAGHGGKDPGAIGYNKTYEKDVALAVALKFGAYVQKNFPDVKVIYTRKTDEFLELHQRAEVANKAKADLFVAIHCNSSTNHEVYGTSSYILGLHRTEANLEVAKRENAVILLEDDRDKNYEFNPNTPEGHIIMSMKQNAFLDQSIDFAAKLEGQLENYASRKSMGVKQAGFYVLYKTAMPSLLAEIGFISNQEEEKYLNSPKGQDQIAASLFNAFKDYKTEMEGGESDADVVADKKPETVVTPVKKETPPPTKATTAPTTTPPPVKETQPIVKEATQPPKPKTETVVTPPVKETAKAVEEVPTPAPVTINQPVPTTKEEEEEEPAVREEPIKEATEATKEEVKAPAPEIIEKVIPTSTPPVVKETVAVAEKTDPDYATLSDGTKIRKPVERASGGGKTSSTSTPQVAVEINEVEKQEVKETKPAPVETPAKPVVKPNTTVVEKKSTVTETKPTPAPVKTEVKTTTVTKTTEVKSQETVQPAIISNRHPLVPLSKPESGVIFKIQLFSLKGELREYDKFMKLFTILTAEELPNGITRYYGAKTKSMAEAKKFHGVAVANGYKDSYIVGFKDGTRMSFEELKAAE